MKYLIWGLTLVFTVSCKLDYKYHDKNIDISEDFSLCELNHPGGQIADDGFWSGSGSSLDPFKVCSAAQLNLIGPDYPDKHFVVINNINLDFLEEDFNSIVLDGGSFDGGGYTISNASIEDLVSTGWSEIGFFSSITNSTVENTKFKNISINAPDASVAGLIGNATCSDVINVEISDISVKSKDTAGGLVGYATTNCNPTYIDSNISNVSVKGEIQATECGSSGAGGLIGLTEGGWGTPEKFVMLDNISFEGKILTSASCVGGIAGYGIGAIVTNATVNAEISGDWAVGGIFGQFGALSEVEDSSFTGSISGDSQVGGIAGLNLTDSMLVRRTSVSGAISGINYVGGVIGDILGQSFVFADNTVQGTVSGTTYVGGILGRDRSDGEAFNNFTSSADVTGTTYAGSLFGNLDPGSSYDGTTISTGSINGDPSGNEVGVP